jgi:S1-C subfamily serine protease
LCARAQFTRFDRSVSAIPRHHLQEQDVRTTPLLLAALNAAAPSLLVAQQPRLNLDSLRRAVVTIHALDADGSSIASGTGFFVFYNGAEGLVVTAAHVLEGASGCSIELTNGETRRCSPTASDTAKDVMMLLVPGLAPATLKWGFSDRAQDGDDITVISNPLGELPGTVSKGIISASRIVNGTKLLQISAPISHGSSGAPVLNAQGQVIGIVRSTIESGQALNFATATDIVRNMQMDHAAIAEARGMMQGGVAASHAVSVPSSASSAGSDARAVTVGQTVTGALSERDELYSDNTYYQRWQFRTTPGQDVTIDLSSTDFRPALILHGLDTSVVNIAGGPACGARISLTFPGTGPYEILVNTSAMPVRQTGRFSLSLSNGIKPVTHLTGHCPPGGNGAVHAIAVGQTVNGQLTSTDDLLTDTTYYQRWRFSAPPGQDVTVDLASPDFDPELLLYGLDSTLVNDDGGPGCASRIVLTPTTSGPYVVLVNTTSRPPRQTGSFTLSISSGRKPVDPPGTRDCQAPGGAAASGGGGHEISEVHERHSIAIGQSVSGQITSNDEEWVDSTYIERWTVNGRAGQTVTIDLTSTDFDAYLIVDGPGIATDHNSDDNSGGKCNARLVVTFTDNAPYEIDVNTQGRKKATGAFVLSVTSGAKPKSDTPCHPS